LPLFTAWRIMRHQRPDENLRAGFDARANAPVAALPTEIARKTAWTERRAEAKEP